AYEIFTYWSSDVCSSDLLTQSAVSRQIKELEDQLGVPLFHRRHRALVLTEAGQQFYAATAQVLTTMRTATSRLRAQSGRRTLSRSEERRVGKEGRSRWWE